MQQVRRLSSADLELVVQTVSCSTCAKGPDYTIHIEQLTSQVIHGIEARRFCRKGCLIQATREARCDAGLTTDSVCHAGGCSRAGHPCRMPRRRTDRVCAGCGDIRRLPAPDRGRAGRGTTTSLDQQRRYLARRRGWSGDGVRGGQRAGGAGARGAKSDGRRGAARRAELCA